MRSWPFVSPATSASVSARRSWSCTSSRRASASAPWRASRRLDAFVRDHGGGKRVKGLFSGDTILSAGVVGGVLGSGNVSDYIHSLSGLAALKVDHLYPGHGNVSATADQDIRTGIRRLENLHRESKALFDTMQHSRNSFDQILHSLKDQNID